MKKLIILTILLLTFGVGYLLYEETNNIVIKEQNIQDIELAKIMSKKRVIQISDLHIERVGVRERRLINLINKINPDIIFITGDFVSRNDGIKPCMEVLKQFSSNRILIAILGNNDHSYKKKIIDTKSLLRGLEKIGVKVLINESLRLTVQQDESLTGNSLYIVGLDDNFLRLDDIFKAMNNVPAESPKILLAHSPNIVEKINTEGINLILSGHTHGGQIVLPLIGALYTNPVCDARKKFVSGLYNESAKLYVNRGIGTVEIPIRLFCKPEITILKFI